MRILNLLLLSALLACTPLASAFGRPTAVQTTCPPDDPDTRNGLISLLSNDRARIGMGLMYVRPSALRVLSAPADLAVCQALLEKSRATPVNPDHVLRYALYEADGYYFVGITFYTTTGEFVYAPGQVAVFDSALNQVDFTNF